MTAATPVLAINRGTLPQEMKESVKGLQVILQEQPPASARQMSCNPFHSTYSDWQRISDTVTVMIKSAAFNNRSCLQTDGRVAMPASVRRNVSAIMYDAEPLQITLRLI